MTLCSSCVLLNKVIKLDVNQAVHHFIEHKKSGYHPSGVERRPIPGVEFRFGLRESKLILKFQLLHISIEKLILISGCYENHCENRFSDSRRISSPESKSVRS